MAPAAAPRDAGGGKIAPKKSLFDDDGSSSEDDQEEGGAALGPSSELKINQEFARRFEHNKKREELHRLEEKYKSGKANGTASGSESSSEDETEDDEGFLVTEDLDAEISATLQAIKNKDPRIYDKSAVFYRPLDQEADASAKDKKEKPVTLRDYHRERYMRGDTGADDDQHAAEEPKTYTQEQADLKQSIISEINAAAAADDSEEWSGDETFMKPKEQQPLTKDGVHPSRAANHKLTDDDLANADKDPEAFLQKFMAARAWAAGDESKWEAFESDDGEENAQDLADEFEHAYNMRFEDPEKSNEVLKSYSRNLAMERSVRREEATGRKKQRLLEKERKEREKQEREEERRRLRRLKLEEAQDKLKKIKQAAGVSGKDLKEEDWMKFLDDAWEDNKWEEEMKRRFGDEYYAQADGMYESDGGEDGAGQKKPKKPKWDDDIDVKDIIPEFDDSAKPAIALTDSEAEPTADAAGEGNDDDDDGGDDDDDEDDRPAKKRKTGKDAKKDRAVAKREARRELARLEALVDSKMELEHPRALGPATAAAAGPSSSRSGAPAFRYRETSPQSFGMTARDILLAPSDAALNEFAGLKKLASFRDAEKKRRDRKKLGKKARLREWRREVFGRDFERTGPTFGFDEAQGAEPPARSRQKQQQQQQPRRAAGGPAKEGGAEEKQKKRDGPEGNVVDGERKKKRKRSKGKKAKAQTTEE